MKENRTYVEKTLSLIPIPYPMTSILIGVAYCISLFGAATICGGYDKAVKDLGMYTTGGYLIILFMMVKYFSEQTRKDIAKIGSLFKASNTEASSLLDKFQKLLFGRISLLFIISFIPLQIIVYWLTYAPPLKSVLPYETPYTGPPTFVVYYTSYSALMVGTTANIIIGLLIGTIGWQCLCTFGVLYEITPKIRLRKESLLDQHRMGGLRPIAHLSLVMVAAAASCGILIPQMIVSVAFSVYLIPYILLLTGYAIFLLFIFLLPLYRVHDVLTREKERMLKEVGESFIRISEKIEEEKNSKEIQTLNVLFTEHKTIFNEIMLIKIWPVDLGIITKVLSSVVIPLITLLLKTIISEWLSPLIA